MEYPYRVRTGYGYAYRYVRVPLFGYAYPFFNFCGLFILTLKKNFTATPYPQRMATLVHACSVSPLSPLSVSSISLVDGESIHPSGDGDGEFVPFLPTTASPFLPIADDESIPSGDGEAIPSYDIDSVLSGESIPSGDGESNITSKLHRSPISDASVMVKDAVNEKDFEFLLHAMNTDADGPLWQSMMEKSTPNMTYHAWRYDPPVGPTQYRSRTIFADATPELIRDFFWDDEFRTKWDRMLIYYSVLEECPSTGTMIVHWIKKFPFFCSDREYIIGRRIWKSGSSFYCVTKGISYPAVPRRDTPKRVELYFSSWCIRPVQSWRGDDQLSACEVTLIHYEDMGIPKDVAKFGVQHGMWNAVKRLHSGARAYQNARKSVALPSRYARMARINTEVSADSRSSYLETSSITLETNQTPRQGSKIQEKQNGNCWKWIVIGSAIAVVCGIHTNVVGKALLFGAARRLARK